MMPALYRLHRLLFNDELLGDHAARSLDLDEVDAAREALEVDGAAAVDGSVDGHEATATVEQACALHAGSGNGALRSGGVRVDVDGGGVGSAITAVPGSSAVFMGGVISYDNSVKQGVLGVSPETLATVGAVSPETAEQMAVGARKLLKVDYAVSVTGIAGPDGGSAEKPVGLVWFGIATPSGLKTEKRIFSGNRAEVRAATVEHALSLLLAAAE